MAAVIRHPVSGIWVAQAEPTANMLSHSSTAKALLQSVKAFLIDLDGTTYLGNRILPGAPELVQRLRATRRPFLFLTNNPSKDAREYTAKLRRLGIQAQESEIFTSGMATLEFLLRKGPRRVFLLGTASLEREFTKAGFLLTDQAPDYVVLAFDTTINYSKMDKACQLLRAGVEFIATNPDLVCPTEQGYLPDCGSFIALFKAATGREPRVIGKPNREMVEAALGILKVTPPESAMVGDRLYTDMRMARESGMKAILVLSGETRPADLEGSPWKPDLVLPSMKELAELLG
jgi:HAD superfamily hydrolase (TIGR01457 family)